MLTAHRVEDIRAAEKSLAATLPEGELMRRAARGLADALDVLAAGDLVVMLIGPGNNGGDALFAAVHLLDRGVRVDLCLLDESRSHAEGLAAARGAGAQVVREPTGQRFCLDAIFGIGARPGGLSGTPAAWAEWIDDHRPHTVAVGVPSGVDVDGATLPGSYVRADATITLGTYKNALLLDPAAGAAGSVTLVDIGLAEHLPAPSVEAIEASDGSLLAPAVPGAASHKYTRGVVGVAAGSEQYAGAAHLCVAGAQSGLAGMVRFVGSAELSRRIVERAPEVVAGRARVQVWVVGPGGGGDAGVRLQMALEDGVPVVVDASALQHLPASFDVPALLTPHAGELAAMLGTDRESVEADPLAHAQRAAERWNATVLLKGRRTVVAHTGSPTRVNRSGSPWLGTAGAGDVLAGFAGSLLAAGLDARDAGSLAAFLHGTASIHANPGGPITASDVARALPSTVASFLLTSAPGHGRGLP
ncbi:bifunctional ADP-dependent NAD(P)H-hydrate dehydratase/NAD(P)H-hydrate epimerase [Aeromicrobium sp.]|uniref:bifunctional ADP-dependent NAD(P)H-hydrate dehydratase/NAD(P)H-hydrate epimerase n=1 Tax=Aeromicrobium sp. TaxID=1871063 RepID=UPI0019B729DA|nr:bifunctional ADP-dependent NAD(P)H-hydrate dehydratase/NAD(P)H-hydrate epimerase [Aeromicrobium sp.]MBC7633735.1 bifunctional ADP-dependent NAD(P)H-hydrate dehydratase/NAD(P)H-hydrate epimerase [Aeromicrobium sp.]